MIETNRKQLNESLSFLPWIEGTDRFLFFIYLKLFLKETKYSEFTLSLLSWYSLTPSLGRSWDLVRSVASKLIDNVVVGVAEQ